MCILYGTRHTYACCIQDCIAFHHRTFISHLLCVYLCICIILMQRLPGAAIQPPPSHVAEKFQSYYNTITLTSLDMLTFANQIASGMVSEAKTTLAHCVPCMLMNSSMCIFSVSIHQNLYQACIVLSDI